MSSHHKYRKYLIIFLIILLIFAYDNIISLNTNNRLLIKAIRSYEYNKIINTELVNAIINEFESRGTSSINFLVEKFTNPKFNYTMNYKEFFEYLLIVKNRITEYIKLKYDGNTYISPGCKIEYNPLLISLPDPVISTKTFIIKCLLSLFINEYNKLKNNIEIYSKTNFIDDSLYTWIILQSSEINDIKYVISKIKNFKYSDFTPWFEEQSLNELIVKKLHDKTEIFSGIKEPYALSGSLEIDLKITVKWWNEVLNK